MTPALACGIAFLTAYLVGSLPFGLLIARFVAGVDIRQQGSGNIGATNVARVLGKKLGLAVLVLDCLKGALPTALLPWALADSSSIRLHLAVLSGAAAILGHMFPCWLKFRGGKGVATALGVALVLAPIATAAAFAVFALCVVLTRIVSLCSVLAACTFCGVELWWLGASAFDGQRWSLAAFSVLAPLLIIIRHRTNLVRLMRGVEPRFEFGGKSKQDPSPPAPSDQEISREQNNPFLGGTGGLPASGPTAIQ
jgi:acyl phosphate:glycerol-3-phosphate acyltransferase